MSKLDLIKKVLPTLTLVLIVLLSLYVVNIPNSESYVKIEVINNENLTYKDFDKINVLVDGKIVNMELEKYLVNVLAGEMYPDYDMEALKAQGVTARTYTYTKLVNGGCGNGGAQICDDINHCQAYAKYIPKEHVKKIESAIRATKGEIITYDGKPIIALFHSTSGGKTEDNVNVFGQDLPYLKSVDSQGEDDSPRFFQKEVRTIDEIKEKTQTTGRDIKVLERLNSGRVRNVDVFGKTMSGKELREILGLSSANFEVEIKGDNVEFSTKGYGHGVGLSQVGANAMAKNGYNYKDIIKHYFSGVQISKITQ